MSTLIEELEWAAKRIDCDHSYSCDKQPCPGRPWAAALRERAERVRKVLNDLNAHHGGDDASCETAWEIAGDNEDS